LESPRWRMVVEPPQLARGYQLLECTRANVLCGDQQQALGLHCESRSAGLRDLNQNCQRQKGHRVQTTVAHQGQQGQGSAH
jgi:hypothetical protein